MSSEFIGTYKNGQYDILITKDLGRWHLSISHPHKYPSWRAIKDARYKYLPKDIFVAMILPPPENFINAHPNCFHLWEVQDPLKHIIWNG